MKKIQLFALVLCLLLALQSVCVPAVAETEPQDLQEETLAQEDIPLLEDPTVIYGPHSADGRYPILGSENILQSSTAAILYEVTSDTLVYTWNPDMQLFPSSLAKIMTALVAVENGDLTETVTVTRRVLDTVPQEALIAGLYHEEELTLEQLLYVMMVGSANDAAAVIADHIGGSQQAFVEMMNEKARELGCTGTNFINAHGLHNEAQVTTARDMVKIIRAAMEHPEFQEIFGAVNYTLDATNKSASRYFQTTNYLGSDELTDDYFDSRVTGGRTGNTNDGLRNVAITAESDGARYIVVVLSAKSEYASNGVMTRQGAFEDAAVLLDLGFDGCEAGQVAYAGQIVDQIPVTNGENHVVIGPNETVSCVFPKKLDMAQLTFRVDLVSENLTAPVQAGDYVGEYQIYYGSLCVASVSLYAQNGSAVSAAAAQQIQQPEEDPGFDAGALSTAFMVLGIIFAVILVGFGGLFLVRKLRSAMGKKRREKRREDRRRSR